MIRSNAFQHWIHGQNPSIQRLMRSGDGDDLLTVLELFEASKRIDPSKAEEDFRNKTRRFLQMQASTDVPRSGLSGRSGPADDFADAFEYYAARDKRERDDRATRLTRG